MTRATKAALISLRAVLVCERNDAHRDGSRLGQALRGEDGLVTWITLIAIVFMLVMACLIANVGHTISHKIETQNGADSVAYSGTTWMARGMNAITASNHLIGELMSLYVMHHALGGKYLDEHYADGDKNSTTEMNLADLALKAEWYVGAPGAGWIPNLSSEYPVPVGSEFDDSGLPSHYDEVKEDPVADERSTIYKAKLRLKMWMIGAYEAHRDGFDIWLIGQIPFLEFLQPIGLAIMWSAYAVEWKVYQEYELLDALESFARRVSFVKQNAIPMTMQALEVYQQSITWTFPGTARLAGKKIGTDNRAFGVFAGPGFPVVTETTTDENHSQLMRASYPWVAGWRQPILDFFAWGEVLSGARGYYLDYTNEYSYNLCRLFREPAGQDADNPDDLYSAARRGHRLLVMTDMDPSVADKGQERWAWAAGSDRADELFCWIGIARRQQPPALYGPSIFRQENPDGVICISQAMLYNANPEQQGDGAHQPRGWDTLNWTNAVPEYSTTSDTARPHVKLNWQAKLSPITGRKLRSIVGDASIFADSEDRKTLEALLKRMNPALIASPEQLITH